MKIEKTVRKYTEGASRVKLPGGIVGKTCYVLMAVAGSLGAMVVAIRSEIIGYVAIGALTLIVLPTLRRLFQFAERHPQVAILEGSEYIEYEQIQLAQKGVGTLPPSPAAPATESLDLPPAERAALQLPDPVQEKPRLRPPKSNG